MKYTVYKTINTLNNKYYIGAHKTNRTNDFYLGSGTALKLAIKKYGRSNFTKEVLFIYSTEVEMWAKEEELVTIKQVEDRQCYNMSYGGHGNNSGPKSTEHRRNIGLAFKGKALSKEHCIKISEAKKGKEAWNKGIKMEGPYPKISEAMKGRRAWNKGLKTGPPPNKGSIAVSKGGKRRYIQIDDLSSYEQEGWKRGLKH